MSTLVSAPHSSAMLPVQGPLYWLSGLPWFMRRLRMEDHSAERVRRAAEQGPIVYALHTRSHVDWLALQSVLNERRLPLPAFTNDFDARRWFPLGLLGRLFGTADRSGPEQLSAFVAAGQPTCIFLGTPWDVRELVGLAPHTEDVVPHLVAAQARCARPVQVLPVVVIWDRSPEPTRTEVGRFLLGTEDSPGPAGKLLALAGSQGQALVQVGEPITLSEWIERFADEPPAKRDRRLRLVLRRFLYRESRVVRGPRARPRGFVRRQVLESHEVRELIQKESVATGRPPEEVLGKVAKNFDKIAAQFSFPYVRFAGWFCFQIWNRIYSGIDVREEDLERVRSALRDGTPILVPCHRSHLDYLLISSLLLSKDIVIPHIVAGDNLSFFPIGGFLRRCGAFFIKRSFHGDRIFPVVFERYLRELVRMEVPVEFFIEGGRSRTGKLLPPKVGVLGMVMDAAANAREGRAVTFLPIYVGYEQIAEERAYARELAGASKEKESVGQLARAAAVIRERYGKVYLRVGEPIRADSLGTAAEWRGQSPAKRDEALLGLGERILHRINGQAVLLPTSLVALAVLAHPRRGVRREELRARVERLRAFLQVAGVKEGRAVAHVDGILGEAIARFQAGGMLTEVKEGAETVYIVEPSRRLTLEYYKNAVMHAFAPAAYFAAAVRALGRDEIDLNEVTRLLTVQQFLLRYEFVLDPDADAQEHERRAVAELVAYGAVELQGTQVTVVDRSRVGEVANLAANFLESYLLLLLTAGDGRSTWKSLPADALTRGRAMLAADELSRPESLNLVNLQNAARAFREDNVLLVAPDGTVSVEAEGARSYREDLLALLARSV
jgi:glycerol-3-phosphate O-acyltransferase